MISVIVPAFNAESTISRTLDSILAQTYLDIEVLVVNDGSTDGTREIIDKYSSQCNQVKAIHIQNQGVTTARLTGVSYASGEWIGFVDSDDEIEPDMYEVLLENAEEFEADISHCGYQMIFGDGRISYFHDTGRLILQDKLMGLKDLLDGSFVEPGVCNKIFRKSLFDTLLHSSIMKKDIRINEDLLMNYMLFSCANQSVFFDVCKYHYLIRTTSVSRTEMNQHKIFDPIRVKQIILDMEIEGMQKSAKKAYVGTCVSVFNSLMLDKSNKFVKEQKEVRNLLKQRKKWIALLSMKQQILANMILHCNVIYKPIYRIYAEYFMEDCYE